jgi:hypothetical protein
MKPAFDLNSPAPAAPRKPQTPPTQSVTPASASQETLSAEPPAEPSKAKPVTLVEMLADIETLSAIAASGEPGAAKAAEDLDHARRICAEFQNGGPQCIPSADDVAKCNSAHAKVRGLQRLEEHLMLHPWLREYLDESFR